MSNLLLLNIKIPMQNIEVLQSKKANLIIQQDWKGFQSHRLSNEQILQKWQFDVDFQTTKFHN